MKNALAETIRVALLISLASMLLPLNTLGQQAHSDASGQEYRYYAATIAAADACLQLHDVVAVQHWLDEAPVAQRGWEWSYLKAAADRSAGSFTAHSKPLTDMAMSPDGSTLATTGGEEIILWDAVSGARLLTLAGHTKSAWNARFSPDGSRIASVASDGSLRIWDRVTGKELAQAQGIGSGVAGVAWHPNGREVATVSWKRSAERGVWGVIDLWNAQTGEHLHHIEHGVKPIVSANFAPDGSRLYVGTWDFDVGVYDTGTWSQRFRLFPPEDEVYKAVRECRLNPDGSLLAAAHEDGAVRIWETRTGSLLRVLHQQAEGARLAQNDLVWFPDGKRLATASTDLTIRIWDAVSGKHLLVLHGHTNKVNALALTPDGRMLFSGDASGQVRRWDLSKLAPERYRWELPATGYGVAVSHDGQRAASAGWGGWVAIFDLQTGHESMRWNAHGTSGVRVAWHPGNDLLASSGNDGLVKLWDTRTNPPMLVFEHAVEIQSLAVAFSSDGRFIASPAAGPQLNVWSVRDGRHVAVLDDSVAFSDAVWHPNEPLLAVSGRDGIVRLWKPLSGQVQGRLEGHGDGMLQASFSTSGTLLAAASESGIVRIWRLDSLQLMQEMSVTNGGQIAVAFSPDGSRLATGGWDNNIHLWDPATGSRLLKLPFAESIWEIAWSPDGKRLLAIPLDGTIRVLEAGSVQPANKQ